MDYFNYTDDSRNTNNNQQSGYQPPYHRYNSFSLASCVCGLLSLGCFCTGSVFLIMSLVFASLSIIFAVLGHRKGKTVDNATITGVTTAAITLAIWLFVFVFAYTILPAMLQDETFYKQMKVMYENMYDQDFDSLMEQYYGLEFPGADESDS